MPRKSSKTEQVLRLITKSGERDEPQAAVQDAEPIQEDIIPEEVIAEASEAESTEPEREFAPAPVPAPPAQPAGSTDMRQELKEQLKEELKEELREELGRTQQSNAAKTDEPVTVSEPVAEREPINMELHQAPPPVARSHNLDVINLAEVLAYEKMEEVMGKLNVCNCRLCQADVLALTLNYLPQKYVTTDEDKQKMQLDLYRKQYETDLLSALTRACVRVKGSPRHK